jgi:hypothetical protein
MPIDARLILTGHPSLAEVCAPLAAVVRGGIVLGPELALADVPQGTEVWIEGHA